MFDSYLEIVTISSQRKSALYITKQLIYFQNRDKHLFTFIFAQKIRDTLYSRNISTNTIVVPNANMFTTSL